MTQSSRVRRMVATATAGLVFAASPLAGVPLQTQAATGLQLLTQAEHDTNTVASLTHHDTQTVTSSNVSITLALHGSEDEAHNREADSESATYIGKTSAGKSRTIHYTLDIIFMNGTTYYRSSLVSKNKWLSRKGLSLQDPYSGVGWRRARTTVPVIASLVKHVKYHLIGTSGGLTHFHGSFKAPTFAGTDDLWVSGGSHPYVVREQQRYHSTTKLKQTVVAVDNFGGFNSPVVITPPSTLGGA